MLYILGKILLGVLGLLLVITLLWIFMMNWDAPELSDTQLSDFDDHHGNSDDSGLD